jgi:hypothetical protein
MVEVIRVDFILSYWIFVWWILYMLGIIEYNPKLFLIIALITNIIVFFIKFKNKYHNIFLFLIVVFITKVIPLYTLRNIEINFNQDFPIIIYICLLYLFWIYINDKFHYLYALINGYKNIIPPMEYVIGKMLNQ